MRKTDRLLSSTRRTQLSPQIVATVDTRMSISRPSTDIVIWPSWGRRRSTMFISAMILRRLTSAGAMLRRELDGVVQRPVDAESDPELLALRLDVDVRGPVAHGLGDEQVDYLDDRRIAGV